jgi:hypothetical protein
VIELGEWAKIRRLHRAEGVNDGHTATLTGMVGPCPRCAKWSMLHGRPRASTGFVDHPVVGAMSALAQRLTANAPHASLLGEAVPARCALTGTPLPLHAGTPRRSANALG